MATHIEDTPTKKPDRKRMTVFRAGEGPELDQETMPFAGVDASVMAGFAKLGRVGVPRGAGDHTSLIFSLPGDPGLSLSQAWFKSGYVLPRHSHNADCVYYVLGGSIQLGSQTLGKGDGFFVPAEHGYSYVVGPEGAEVLEFRNAAHFNILFKGNDDAHWDRMAQALEAGKEKWPGEPAPFSVTA
jgi:quercetin dioxygenase-like cupin family protein